MTMTRVFLFLHERLFFDLFLPFFLFSDLAVSERAVPRVASPLSAGRLTAAPMGRGGAGGGMQGRGGCSISGDWEGTTSARGGRNAQPDRWSLRLSVGWLPLRRPDQSHCCTVRVRTTTRRKRVKQNTLIAPHRFVAAAARRLRRRCRRTELSVPLPPFSSASRIESTVPVGCPLSLLPSLFPPLTLSASTRPAPWPACRRTCTWETVRSRTSTPAAQRPRSCDRRYTAADDREQSRIRKTASSHGAVRRTESLWEEFLVRSNDQQTGGLLPAAHAAVTRSPFPSI